MELWWESLGLVGQMLACVAVPATIIIVIQAVFAMFFSEEPETEVDNYSAPDVDDIDDISGKFDARGVQFFTIRGFLTFFAIFGWSGIFFLKLDINTYLSLAFAIGLGFIFMVITAYIFSFFVSMQNSGNMEIESSIGLDGTVYIRIPANRSGVGKINAVVSGRYAEFDAMTDSEEIIPTGAVIKVVGLVNETVLLVKSKEVIS